MSQTKFLGTEQALSGAGSDVDKASVVRLVNTGGTTTVTLQTVDGDLPVAYTFTVLANTSMNVTKRPADLLTTAGTILASKIGFSS